jgi:hypothetical protein
MFKKLSLFLFILSVLTLAGQDNSADSLQHYLILQSKGNHKYSIVFRENKKIEIYDSAGKSFKGKLLFINDSLIKLINPHSSKQDTFLISEITKIRHTGLLNKIVGYPSLVSGSVFFILGSLLVSTSSKSDSIAIAYGIASIVTSAPLLLISAILLHGKSYKISKYDFKILSANNRKLKRKDLKDLNLIKTL